MIFDALGPGRLDMLWFTSGAGGTRPLNQGRVRFYFDDVGDWYTAEGNTASSWSERDFFLPSRFTRGKARLSIRVAPVAESPPWDTAEYRALSVTPPLSGRP